MSPSRRPAAEIRKLLLDAAGRVFAEKGFAAATAEGIAERAGVARSAMYRQFGNKAELFSQAVVQPFVEFLDEFDQLWQSQLDDPLDDYKITRAIVELFYDSSLAHRDALIGLASAQDSLDPEILREVEGALDRMFARLVGMIQREAIHRNWPTNQLEMTMRLLLGSIGSMTALDHLFLPAGKRKPSREEILDHVSLMFLYGARLAPQ